MSINLPLSKLPDVKTTIFTEMSMLASQHNAINLSQGFPDFPADDDLIAYLGEYSKAGYNQYAPLSGVQILRERLSDKFSNQYQSYYHPDSEINITAGATQAIFTAMAAFINPGDEVVIFEPAYDCYEPTVKLFGGEVKRVILEYPDFQINWDFVKNLISKKTKIIVINNPNNPSGKILKQQDIDQLISIVANTDVIIISDEVYESIIFDNKKHLSFSAIPELKERSFVIGSFGKLFHITGWKIGYTLAPVELMKEFRKVHQFNVFCVNTPAQMALAKYLKNENSYSGISDFYQEKRDYFLDSLSASAFSFLESEGSYFLSANYKNISELGDRDFSYWLTREHKVSTIPFSAFYANGKDDNLIRFCFAKKRETLDLAIENLLKIKI